MVPYIFTFIGMLLRQWYVNVISPEGGGVTFLTIVAVLLTGIGVFKTYTAQGGKYADRKQLGIALGIHAVIWLAGLLLFNVVSWILGKIVYLIALIIGLVIAYYMFRSMESGGNGESYGSRTESGTESGVGALPDIMYDGHERWQIDERGGDYAVYKNDNGATVTIRHATISGGSVKRMPAFFNKATQFFTFLCKKRLFFSWKDKNWRVSKKRRLQNKLSKIVKNI